MKHGFEIVHSNMAFGTKCDDLQKHGEQRKFADICLIDQFITPIIAAWQLTE